MFQEFLFPPPVIRSFLFPSKTLPTPIPPPQAKQSQITGNTAQQNFLGDGSVLHLCCSVEEPLAISGSQALEMWLV